MQIFSLILSLFLSVVPPTSFICDGEILNTQIINNTNGDFKIINDLDQIDEGAFIVLNWGVNLMLPRTFIANEISFSDNKWKWIYTDINHPKLLERRPLGEIIEYPCRPND